MRNVRTETPDKTGGVGEQVYQLGHQVLQRVRGQAGRGRPAVAGEGEIEALQGGNIPGLEESGGNVRGVEVIHHLQWQ